MQLIGKFLMLAVIFATNVNAACVSAPNGDRALSYTVTTIAGEKPPVVSIVGDIRHTWIELAPNKSWPVPLVRMNDGDVFYIHWEDDKGCLRVGSGGQDFVLGDASSLWKVTRK